MATAPKNASQVRPLRARRGREDPAPSKAAQEVQVALWTQRVWDKRSKVDPDDERDWYDVAYGFFLHTFDVETSHNLANEMIRRGLL